MGDEGREAGGEGEGSGGTGVGKRGLGNHLSTPTNMSLLSLLRFLRDS